MADLPKDVMNSIHVQQDGVAMVFAHRLSVWNKINQFKTIQNQIT